MTPSVPRLRPALLADAEALGRVHVAAWQVGYRGLMPDAYLDGLDADEFADRWQRLLAAGGGKGRLGAGDDAATGLVAEDPSGGVVGFTTFGSLRGASTPDVGEVRSINVTPARWGGGTGGALLSAAVNALSHDYRSAVLWVVEGNQRGRRFYERSGWAATGAVKVDERFGFPLRELGYGRALPERDRPRSTAPLKPGPRHHRECGRDHR